VFTFRVNPLDFSAWLGSAHYAGAILDLLATMLINLIMSVNNIMPINIIISWHDARGKFSSSTRLIPGGSATGSVCEARRRRADRLASEICDPQIATQNRGGAPTFHPLVPLAPLFLFWGSAGGERCERSKHI
jgi:hypothetical protein